MEDLGDIEENDIKDEPDETTKNRISLAWKCILEQYFECAKKTSMEEGPGISIFKFLRTPRVDGSNCQYLYTEKDGYMWKDVINFSPEGEKIQEIYDPVTMVAICIHVPLGIYGEKTIGNLKLFHRESEQEITTLKPVEENEKSECKNTRTDIFSESEDCKFGLRKRKVSRT